MPTRPGRPRTPPRPVLPRLVPPRSVRSCPVRARRRPRPSGRGQGKRARGTGDGLSRPTTAGRTGPDGHRPERPRTAPRAPAAESSG
ncbi:Hypothetical protein SCLAV_0963 [Streptomyces clavuligerus]|uniref:Uncharacterized protein n=1 Tax=Streptomyces clavuligerus TaxID=1901 RepID=E2PXB8_STRCL|nr:Hypothetical protein SCLAV_0963 [Streptomyces clavuligerus]